MDIRKVKKLIELLNESGVAEIEITEGEDSVRISRQSRPAKESALESQNYSIPLKETPQNVDEKQQSKTDKITHNELDHEVLSPMVGTFYASPSQDAPPYVQAGDHVKEGDTLCIIEAMKMMNKIEAEVTGVIRSVRVKNGEPVEYDQILFIIDQDSNN